MATFQQVLVRPRRRSHAITGVVRSPAEKAPRPSLKRAAAMLVLAAFFAFPIVFMFVASFKPDGQLLRDVSSIRAFVPYGDLSLDNYRGVFARVPAARFIFNSVLISTVTVGLGLFVNSLAGFALGEGTQQGAQHRAGVQERFVVRSFQCGLRNRHGWSCALDIETRPGRLEETEKAQHGRRYPAGAGSARTAAERPAGIRVFRRDLA
jgi:hypothetical protein